MIADGLLAFGYWRLAIGSSNLVTAAQVGTQIGSSNLLNSSSSLNPTNLTSGTAGISITGNAPTATWSTNWVYLTNSTMLTVSSSGGSNTVVVDMAKGNVAQYSMGGTNTYVWATNSNAGTLLGFASLWLIQGTNSVTGTSAGAVAVNTNYTISLVSGYWVPMPTNTMRSAMRLDFSGLPGRTTNLVTETPLP